MATLTACCVLRDVDGWDHLVGEAIRGCCCVCCFQLMIKVELIFLFDWSHGGIPTRAAGRLLILSVTTLVVVLFTGACMHAINGWTFLISKEKNQQPLNVRVRIDHLYT